MRFTVFVAALFTCLPSLCGAQYGVYFDYHRPNPDNPKHIDHPHLEGVFRRFGWADLEPSPGRFDFTEIDRNIAVWSAAGKKVLFGVSLAGQQAGVTPDWYFDKGAAIDFVRSGKGTSVKTPEYWDSSFVPAVAPLIHALGEHYENDTRVEAVMIGVGHIGFITAAPNPEGARAFLKAGWTPQIWKDYTWALIRVYREAFPTKPLFIRGSDLVVNVQNPAAYGFPESRPKFLDVRDDILVEAATHYGIGVGCNGLEGDVAKFLAGGMPSLYERLAPGAREGRIRLELSDDWPMWVNATRRANSSVDAKADNEYFGQCLENAVGGSNGIPRLGIGWMKMLETDLDCTDPANPDYQPDCEKKLIWLKEQLMAAKPSTREVAP